MRLLEGGHYRYDLVTPSGTFEGCTLGIPGWVNIENAVAAVASVWCAAKAAGTGLDAERLREQRQQPAVKRILLHIFPSDL